MSVFFIFLSTFLVSAGYGVLMSLSMFVLSLGGSEEVSGGLFALSGVGTITAVFICKKLLQRFHGKYVGMLGASIFCLGALILSQVHHLKWEMGLGVLLTGAGWGCFFNAMPYMLSLLTTQQNRSVFFNYFAACIVSATGLGPICIHFAYPEHIHFAVVFAMAGLSALCGLLSLTRLETHQIQDVCRHLPKRSKTFQRLMRSVVMYPLAMTFLTACIFTMMNNFQMTYAKRIGLNYADFYIVYTLAVVASRLLLGKWLASRCQYLLTIVLTVLVTGSIALFFWAGDSHWMYRFASAALGVSYGLLYPTVQAITVNLAEPEDRSEVISYFSFAYFIAVFAFPVIGGAIIVHTGYHGLLVSLMLLMLISLGFAWKLRKYIRERCF